MRIDLLEWQDIADLPQFRDNPFIPLFEILMESKDYVDIKEVSPKGIRIKAKNFVGLFPLSEEYLVTVSPKAPVEDFLYVLFKAQGRKVKPKEFETVVQVGREKGIERPNLFHFLLYVFLSELERVRTSGFLKRSVPQVEARKSIKGKILIKDTLFKSHLLGKKDEVWCSYYDLSKEIPENLTIKFTLWLLLSLYQLASAPRRDFFEKYRYFASIPLIKRPDFLEDIEETLYKGKLPPSRSYYYDILNLCLFFITHSTLEYKSAKEVKVKAFVVDMNKVFEEYIRHILEEALYPDVRVRKESSRHVPLFDNREASEYWTEPDLVFEKGKSPLLVGDTKYKEKPEDGDFYQMLTYLDLYGTKRGLLVYPRFERQELKQDEFTRGDKRIWVYRVDMDNIKFAEDETVSFVRSLM